MINHFQMTKQFIVVLIGSVIWYFGCWLVSKFDDSLWQQWSLPSTEISF